VSRRTLTETEILTLCQNVTPHMRRVCRENGWQQPEEVLRGLPVTEQPIERLEVHALQLETLWHVLLSRAVPVSTEAQ
jgi:hypothetical protein